MNRDAMLVALGVGVGALISTEQGRHIIGSLAKTPVAQALGEGTMSLFKPADHKDREHDKEADPEMHGDKQNQQQMPQSEAAGPLEEQGV